MNCTNCGSNLPGGAANCPTCGSPTPYNVSAPSGSYDPTVVASPYGTPPPPSGTPSYNNPTAYGTPSYGAPNAPIPPDPYGNQVSNSYGGSNAYAPPPPPMQQPVYAPGQFGSQMQGPPQKPKSKLPLILGIVGGVLLLLCIGACALIYAASKNNTNTTTTTGTATTTTATTTTNTTPAPTTGTTPSSNTTTGPSGQTIVPAAAAIITDAKSSSSIDSNYHPTNPTSTFQVNQTVYVTFNLHLQQKGYIEVKWYVDGTFGKSKILALPSTNYSDAYFSETYLTAADGAAEVYWCTKSDCSDAQLADVVNFTVTSSSSIQPPTQASFAAVMDMDRRA